MTEYTGDEFTDRMNVEAIAEMEQREIKRLRAALERKSSGAYKRSAL